MIIRTFLLFIIIQLIVVIGEPATRDWKNYDLNQFSSTQCDILQVDGKHFTPLQFDNLMKKQIPFIIRKHTLYSKAWQRANRKWQLNELKNLQIQLHQSSIKVTKFQTKKYVLIYLFKKKKIK